MGQLHKMMLSVRELGNEKLELTSHMLDTVSVCGGGRCAVDRTLLLTLQVEDYSHQLTLREKDMDNCRTREDTVNLRFSLSSHPHKMSTASPVTATEGSEKKKNDS